MSDTSTSAASASGTSGIREPGLLAIYCNDHLMSATGGIELVQRMIGAHRGTPYEEPLATLLEELHEERAALTAMTTALGFPVRQYKQLAGWVGEKLARAKLNGHLLSRSPMSSVVEFEFMGTAVLGKRAGFETLRMLADVDPRLDAAVLDRLIAQANRQHEWLTKAHREVVAQVWGGDSRPAGDAAGT